MGRTAAAEGREEHSCPDSIRTVPVRPITGTRDASRSSGCLSNDFCFLGLFTCDFTEYKRATCDASEPPLFRSLWY